MEELVPGLSPYASFSARRREWAGAGSPEARTVTAVVDESDIDGFSVGEVEVMVEEEGGREEAGGLLDEAKEVMGVVEEEGGVQVNGKLYVFLQKFNQELLEIAREAGAM